MNFDEERERRINNVCVVHSFSAFGWWITLFYILSFTKLDFDTYFFTAFLIPIASFVLFAIRLLLGFIAHDFDDKFSKIHYIFSFSGFVFAFLVIVYVLFEWLFKYLLNTL